MLTLTKTSEYEKLTKWTGTLEMNSGTIQGTWDVEFGTTKYNVKPKNIQALTSGKKIGLLERFQFWKKSKARNANQQNAQGNEE